MDPRKFSDCQSSYDRIAEEYANRISGELDHKPLDRMLLDEFAARFKGAGGLLFLAFHIGLEVVHEENCWGHQVSLDLVLFGRKEVERYLGLVGFAIEDALEREPYAPEVEYQSRRAYIRARKPTRA